MHPEVSYSSFINDSSNLQSGVGSTSNSSAYFPSTPTKGSSKSTSTTSSATSTETEISLNNDLEQLQLQVLETETSSFFAKMMKYTIASAGIMPVVCTLKLALLLLAGKVSAASVIGAVSSADSEDTGAGLTCVDTAMLKLGGTVAGSLLVAYFVSSYFLMGGVKGKASAGVAPSASTTITTFSE